MTYTVSSGTLNSSIPYHTHAVTLLPTGGIAFVKLASRCLVRSARVISGSDFDILYKSVTST